MQPARARSPHLFGIAVALRGRRAWRSCARPWAGATRFERGPRA
jgi:hypothetical protein